MRKSVVGCVVIAIWLAAGWATAQKREGAAQPKSSDRGPKLEATMKYLQDTLNGVGLVSYAAHGHDSNNGHDWTNQFSDQASGVLANPSVCRITYHWKSTFEGKVLEDKNAGFLLKDVQKIEVQTRAHHFDEDNLAYGHPSWTVKVEPPVYVLSVQRTGLVQNNFSFPDEELAQRVAKSMAEAVELCHDGNITGTSR
jgi:hypothetical protein